MMEARSSPQAVTLERQVLGAIMDSPDQAIPQVVDRLRPSDFYRPDHARLYSLLLEDYARNRAIDRVTFLEKLVSLPDRQVEELGGITYLFQILADAAPSWLVLRHYSDVIRECANRRDVIRRLQRWETEIYALPVENMEIGGALDLRDKAVGELLTVGQATAGGWATYDRIGDRLGIEIEDAAGREERGEAPIAITTGFDAVDNRFGRMIGGSLEVLGARPAMGKTAFALDVAERVAHDGREVGFFSLEMSAQELQARSISKRCGLSSRAILEGRIRGAESRVWDAVARVRELPIFVDDRADVSVSDLRSRVRTLAAGCHDLGLVVVDYLQLLKGSNPREPREAQVAEASRTLKAIAKEFQIPVLAMAQLNRSVHDRKDPRPILSDLRESGAIEQDADRVFFLHRPRYYAPDDRRIPEDAAELICAKNRRGSTGIGDLRWHAERTTFEDETRAERLAGRAP